VPRVSVENHAKILTFSRLISGSTNRKLGSVGNSLTAHIPLLIGSLASALVCALLVATSNHHVRWTGDLPRSGPQKLHRLATPRVGGVGIAIGFVIALLATKFGTVAGQVIHAPLALIAALAIPFVAGLYEDLTKTFGATARLIATFIAAAIAFQWAGATMVRFEMPLLDAMLSSHAVAPLLFAMFCVGGIAHSFNLSDGLNGLLGGLALVACALIGAVARSHGDIHAYLCACALAGAVGGFLVFNFPRARIFAGDSGAYFIGTGVALLAILLVARNATITPWIAFAAVLYPFTDTTFAIVRRAIQRRPIMQPDAEHLHSLLVRKLTQHGQKSAHQLASLAIVSVAALFASIASLLSESSGAVMLVCAIFAVVYLVAWRACIDGGVEALPHSLAAPTKRE
jgi:UDP-GlcNAc:undecaprenyl-phosphate/decaprenyl-phosphate GlcNAc-1-phosphate transferase